ncbi:MAG: cyclic nucleotide-binding domain-containing protein [bacterium]|nr:cyclic nucleotide-binding domain-containing protein [bacterium]
MSQDAIRRLQSEFERAQRERNFERALAALMQLEIEQPGDARWPKRAAEIHARCGNARAELDCLLRAFELQIEAEQTTRAIATGQRILALDPDQAETEDRLHLLYMIPSAEADDTESGREQEPVFVLQDLAPAASDAPIDEIVLTDIAADARPVSLGDPEQQGAAEIPLDPGASAPDLALHLDPEISDGGRTIASMARGERDEQALRAKLFAALSKQDIDRLLRDAEIVTVAADEICIRQGTDSTCMYVILEGAMVPFAEDLDDAGDEVEMGVLEAGDFFGEIGLLTRQPRNASVRAIAPSRLLAIDRSAVRTLLHANRDILSLILRTLRLRLVDRLVRTSPLFGCFKRAMRSDFAKQFRLIEVKDGMTVIQEGIPDPGLFVVLAGEVEVSQSSHEDDKMLARLGHGAVLGELSALYGQPAVASVIARGKCWLFSLSHGHFRKILDQNPKLREVLQELGQARALENRRRYSEAGDGG